MKHLLTLACVCALSSGCAQTPSKPAPTAADAKAFLATANATTLTLGTQQGQAGWVQQTFITDDSEAIAARANLAYNEAGAKFAREAVQYDTVQVSADERRQLNLLKVALVLATPSNPAESDELSKIMARLESSYGKGKWCADASKPETCKNIDDDLADPVVAGATKRRCARRGKAGTPSRRRCGRTTSASSSCRTRAPRSSASPTPARCGAASTTCRPTSSPRSSIGCGIRCGRST